MARWRSHPCAFSHTTQTEHTQALPSPAPSRRSAPTCGRVSPPPPTPSSEEAHPFPGRQLRRQLAGAAAPQRRRAGAPLSRLTCVNAEWWSLEFARNGHPSWAESPVFPPKSAGRLRQGLPGDTIYSQLPKQSCAAASQPASQPDKQAATATATFCTQQSEPLPPPACGKPHTRWARAPPQRAQCLGRCCGGLRRSLSVLRRFAPAARASAAPCSFA